MEKHEIKNVQEDFENQFNKNKVLESSGTLLKFVDISPNQDKNAIAILLAPGWAGDKLMFREVLRFFHKRNRRVLFLTHSTHTDSSNEKIKHTSLIETKKAEEILAVIESSGADRVDAVFYSEGGINGILAATRCPKRFRNIILVDPGGFIKERGFVKLIGRFIMETAQLTKKFIGISAKRKNLLRIEKEVLKYIIKNPIRTLKEAKAIVRCDVINMLKILHKKGIGIVIIHSADDKIFPVEKIREIFNDDMVDYFYLTEGSHFGLLIDPEKYVDLVIHAIDFEQKNKAKAKSQ